MKFEPFQVDEVVPSNESRDLMVDDLVSLRGMWDSNIIVERFDSKDAKSILSIPICVSRGKDRMVLASFEEWELRREIRISSGSRYER
ncbi:hypothetical protein DH2020_044613 [Rehmannia glutinosa]|uniref:Uncharacterized protein n=1 Tax=Rehmannia glutinosa TaxID=99300 RepID=A0ABR0UH63_REHGL